MTPYSLIKDQKIVFWRQSKFWTRSGCAELFSFVQKCCQYCHNWSYYRMKLLYINKQNVTKTVTMGSLRVRSNSLLWKLPDGNHIQGVQGTQLNNLLSNLFSGKADQWNLLTLISNWDIARGSHHHKSTACSKQYLHLHRTSVQALLNKAVQ